VATRFFDESLAARVAAKDARFQAAPAIIVRGGASDESGERRTAGVQIAALGGGADFGVPPVARGESAVNGEVANELGVADAGGQTLLLSLPTMQDTPRDATLANRSRQQ